MNPPIKINNKQLKSLNSKWLKIKNEYLTQFSLLNRLLGELDNHFIVNKAAKKEKDGVSYHLFCIKIYNVSIKSINLLIELKKQQKNNPVLAANNNSVDLSNMVKTIENNILKNKDRKALANLKDNLLDNPSFNKQLSEKIAKDTEKTVKIHQKIEKLFINYLDYYTINHSIMTTNNKSLANEIKQFQATILSEFYKSSK